MKDQVNYVETEVGYLGQQKYSQPDFWSETGEVIHVLN
jgi:hypothetical protein